MRNGSGRRGRRLPRHATRPRRLRLRCCRLRDELREGGRELGAAPEAAMLRLRRRRRRRRGGSGARGGEEGAGRGTIKGLSARRRLPAPPASKHARGTAEARGAQRTRGAAALRKASQEGHVPPCARAADWRANRSETGQGPSVSFLHHLGQHHGDSGGRRTGQEHTANNKARPPTRTLVPDAGDQRQKIEGSLHTFLLLKINQKQQPHEHCKVSSAAAFRNRQGDGEKNSNFSSTSASTPAPLGCRALGAGAPLHTLTRAASALQRTSSS